MSNSQAYDEVTVAADGVTVTKRFEADEFPVPAIAFNLTSRRSVPVTVRLVDTVPDDVAVEDLGFHPEYGSDYWVDNDYPTTDEASFPEQTTRQSSASARRDRRRREILDGTRNRECGPATG